VETLRALESAVAGFAGTALIISHDRWFLDRIATHILAFEDDGSQARVLRCTLPQKMLGAWRLAAMNPRSDARLQRCCMHGCCCSAVAAFGLACMAGSWAAAHVALSWELLGA
jgi:hypothetical protein